jgi:serine/threonine protein kinase
MSGKNCKRGLSCGLSCVDPNYECRLNVSPAVSEALDKMVNRIQMQAKPNPILLKSGDLDRIVDKGVLLGEGSAGKVYVEGDVVVKIIDKANEDQVKQEVEINQKMGELGIGPKILSEVQFTEIRGERRAAYAMERVKGVDLLEWAADSYNGDVIKKGRKEESETIIKNMEEQIKRMHDAGFVHNDLSPRNVMVNPKTLEITFIDFGLSQSTQSTPAPTRSGYEDVDKQVVDEFLMEMG